jgi:hypothetical protein
MLKLWVHKVTTRLVKVKFLTKKQGIQTMLFLLYSKIRLQELCQSWFTLGQTNYSEMLVRILLVMSEYQKSMTATYTNHWQVSPVFKHEIYTACEKRRPQHLQTQGDIVVGFCSLWIFMTLNLTNKILRTQAYDLGSYSSWNILRRNYSIEYSAARMLVPRINRLRPVRRFSSFYLAGECHGSGD